MHPLVVCTITPRIGKGTGKKLLPAAVFLHDATDVVNCYSSDEGDVGSSCSAQSGPFLVTPVVFPAFALM
jgi:hypothetical protein